MPASPMTTSTRYVRFGFTKVSYLPACANILSPTRAELNAGTELSGELADSSGWDVTVNFIDTPDLSSAYVGKLAARTSSSDSSITFYQSANSIDVRALLVRGTSGFIAWLDEGDVAGRKAYVFPVTVGSVSPDRSVEDPAKVVVSFAITRTPAEYVTIPA